MKNKSYVTIILDRSGSMWNAREVTVRGFNEQVQAIKNSADENNEVSVFLTTFNESVQFELENKDLKELQELKVEQYMPNGGTALYDAVGYTIKQLEKMEDINEPETSVLFLIITDGEENSSKAFTSGNIAEMIQQLKETGRWTFTYMGSDDVDLSQVSRSMNIDMSNMGVFNTATTDGYAGAYASMSYSTGNWIRAKNVGETLTANFYTQPEGEEDK